MLSVDMKKEIFIGMTVLLLTGCDKEPVPVVEAVPIEPPVVVEEVVETVEVVETQEIEVVSVEPVELTEFRVTAYCACEKCCGKWANLRPRDENGNPIVIGASGEVLATGISCASPYPFGTEINLDGYGTVVVEDRTADWVVEKHGMNIVDIYFDNHQEALEFGLQYMGGVIIDDVGTPGYH